MITVNLNITFKRAATVLTPFKHTLLPAVAMVVALTAGATTTAAQSTMPVLSPAEALKLIARKTHEDTDSGVVMNQTMTVAGQNFYQHFMHAWRDKDGSERHTLVLREHPSARWGSEIRIEFGQSTIFQTRLSISRAGLKQMGEDAAEASYQNLLQLEARRQMSGDRDIANDEL